MSILLLKFWGRKWHMLILLLKFRGRMTLESWYMMSGGSFLRRSPQHTPASPQLHRSYIAIE